MKNEKVSEDGGYPGCTGPVPEGAEERPVGLPYTYMKSANS